MDSSSQAEQGKGTRNEVQTTKYEVRTSTWRVRDIPDRQRPREAMARLGAEHVGEDVLLAILLRSGVKGVNVVDLARGLLHHYGSLNALAHATVEELARIKGMGRVKAQVLKAALEVGRRLQQEAVPDKLRIRTPADVARALKSRLHGLPHEVFWVLHVDAKNCLTSRPVEASRGLLDASLVHPREVFCKAIREACAAVVLAHNHPSGDPTPSAEDLRVTRQLIDAGKIVDIKVLDHVILVQAPGSGGRDYLSLREEGLVRFE